MTAVDHAELKRAEALLESRCKAIDLHYSRFPNSLDRTMEDTAKAIRLVLSEIEGLKAERDAWKKAVAAAQNADAENDAHLRSLLRTRAPDSWRPDREAVAMVIDPLVYQLANALHNSDGEPEALRKDAEAMRDGRMAAALAKADAILALRPQTAESGE